MYKPLIKQIIRKINTSLNLCFSTRTNFKKRKRGPTRMTRSFLSSASTSLEYEKKKMVTPVWDRNLHNVEPMGEHQPRYLSRNQINKASSQKMNTLYNTIKPHQTTTCTTQSNNSTIHGSQGPIFIVQYSQFNNQTNRISQYHVKQFSHIQQLRQS